MYKIRPRRTRPQGILMMCMIMMFLTLAINIIIYELTPQYSSFGSQRYVVCIVHELFESAAGIPSVYPVFDKKLYLLYTGLMDMYM